MHCMYVCICIPPIHAIQHAIFNTYTYALAGSLMYIYNGNLYLTGDINKGTFNSFTGTWTQQELLNDYFVMKGVKSNNGLSIDTTTKL